MPRASRGREYLYVGLSRARCCLVVCGDLGPHRRGRRGRTTPARSVHLKDRPRYGAVHEAVSVGLIDIGWLRWSLVPAAAGLAGWADRLAVGVSNWLRPDLPSARNGCSVTSTRGEAASATFRHILQFAAVGAHVKRRVSFTSSGEPIRYEALKEPMFSETLINMIAANEVADDPEIMNGTRAGARVRIFEEYANGGVEYIQEQVNVRHEPANLVVINLGHRSPGT
jgi:dnd system-associated protein 4